MKLQLLLSDDELDIGMREADMALRLREPMQPDLIRRRLFTVHFHAYASAEYLKKAVSRAPSPTSTSIGWSPSARRRRRISCTISIRC